MKKRKRSLSRATKASDVEPVQDTPSDQPKRNPFLTLIQADQRQQMEHMEQITGTSTVSQKPSSTNRNDAVFPMVVTFLELTRRKGMTRTDSSNISSGVNEQQEQTQIQTQRQTQSKLQLQQHVEDEEGQIQQIAQSLLTTMIEIKESAVTCSSTDRQLISMDDVATLLLPWAIKRVLRSPVAANSSQNSDLVWEILVTCTELLIESNTNSKTTALQLASHLTLSILHKLVPLAGTLALQTSPGNTLSFDLPGTCYCLWVQHLYRPPFDSVVETLIPLIAEKAISRKLDMIHQQNHSPSDDRLYQEMTLATLGLLKDSLKKANFKKAFQSLIRANTLSALSEIYFAPTIDANHIQSIIASILNDGLFHLDHHMDGFRSLQLKLPDLAIMGDDMTLQHTLTTAEGSPQKLFHCYQETLFTTIQESFTLRSIVRIIPLLLQAFIQQTSTIQQLKGKSNETPGKMKITIKKLTQLQFLFFANMTEPIFRSLQHPNVMNEDSSVIVSLQSLDECIKLLLKHDVYLPANDDEGDKNFLFLQSLSKHLMQCVRSHPTKISVKVLPILATTFQLNHLIFHEQLSNVMSNCLPLGQAEEALGGAHVPDEAIEFFCTVISTYKRLRQLDHLCAAFLATATDLRDQNNLHGLQALSRLTQQPKVVSIFSEAVQSSPIQQTKQIVSDYNGWITSMVVASTIDQNTSSYHSVISLVVGLFCYLLKSMRIDSTSAADLSPLCNIVNSGCVQSMMGNANSLKSVDHLVRQGLLLCGWTIDLKNRCDFWLRSSSSEETAEEFKIPETVSAILTEAIEGILQDSISECNGALEELQILACHRLQQLHGRIHERRKIAFATDAEEFGCEVDIKETKQVAKFVLKALQNEKDKGNNFNRRWDILAGVIGSWAPYIEDTDMRWFLSCFFARVTLVEKTNRYTAEGESTFWLLRDASFLETVNVLRNFGPAGITFVAWTVQKILSETENANESTAKNLLSNLAVLPDTSAWYHMKTSDDVQTLFEQGLQMIVKELSTITNPSLPLLHALRCLEILNNVQGTIWDCDEKTVCMYFDLCLRLEYIFRNVARYADSNQSIAFELVALLRKMISRFLKESRTSLDSVASSTMLLSSIFSSTVDMMNVGHVSEPIVTKVLDATRIVITDLIASTQDVALLTEHSKTIENIYRNHGTSVDETKYIVLLSLGSSIVAGFARLHLSLNDRRIQYMVDTMCECIWERSISLVFSTDNTKKSLRHAALLFVAEILINDFKKGAVHDRVNAAETGLVQKCIESIISDVGKEDMLHTSYLLSCLAASKPSRESRHLLFETLANTEVKLPPIVQNALCELATGTNSEDFKDCISMLTSINPSGRIIPTRLRLLRLIVLNAKSEEQIEVIANYSRQLFSMTLGAMTSPWAEADEIEDAVELLEEMASNKDIISIRERDLCLIFAHVVGALGSRQAGRLTVGNKIFNSCFSMVSFLLQRFSKQLHFCIPSVINCLTIILDHCINSDLQDTDVLDRGQKFSRLCELLLPYGDVYKKHVLCLVVAFVDALKHDLDPIRRNSLSPAIYCLLDILQQHEKSQLNSMLDDLGRALLRTVHENYKKQHVYKGQ